MQKQRRVVRGPTERPAPSKKRGAGGEESKVCARFHHAVELIGRRWSGAIISVLLGGPRGFNEMLAAVPGLSDRLLTERLRELESEGLVRRTVIAGPPVRVSYELTEAGESLKPVIESLGRWAERWVKV
ncbi:MAG TPA: helix-turn-helix domain-containing protein [Blastocatellia bacterium]|nr:helix-turn-helix domain-containing protein [Blastocatellia bacterium]